MSDLAAIAVALAAWAGALFALPVPRWLGVGCVLLAMLARRPRLLVVATFLLASGLAAASASGLASPPRGDVTGPALIASDPRPVRHAVQVDLRIGSRRVEAFARGEPASTLRDRLAGEMVRIEGTLRPVDGDIRQRLAIRHVVARLDLRDVELVSEGSVLSRVANDLRRMLERGARPLSHQQRSLLTGVLIGDDRELEPVVESDFRIAGLAHLLAVSGQNVAFIFAVVGPLLRRFGLRGRLVASIAVLALFTMVTRAEPSVLRASGMAAISCWAAFAGRPVARMRVLALAVAGLVLIDPMLARSLGFQLSVAASLGLVVLAAPIALRLPGPRWIAEPLAVTIAAQVAVAPLLSTAFDGVPLIGVIANLLAVPIAGPLTAWGLTAGLVAGSIGAPLDAVLHLPSAVMLDWLLAVARWAARAPVGLVTLIELVVAGAVGLAARRLARPRAAAAALVAALLLFARPTTAAFAGEELARGATVWRQAGAAVLVLDGSADPGRVITALHAAGIRRLDLLVARQGGRPTAEVIADLRSRVRVRAIAAPSGHRIRDATAVTEPLDLVVGSLRLTVEPASRALEVAVGP